MIMSYLDKIPIERIALREFNSEILLFIKQVFKKFQKVVKKVFTVA